MAPAIYLVPSPVIRRVPDFVATNATATHNYLEKSEEGLTELGFSYAFLAAVGIAFIVLIVVDIYIKHGPKPTPGEPAWYQRKFDKAKGGYYVFKDGFNKLLVKRKRRLGLESAEAAPKIFDSQKIIDRLAAKPASDRPASMVEDAEEKSPGPMSGIEVKVTPLDLPFLKDDAAENSAPKDNTAKGDNADSDRAAGL
ncbi:hypothetical protein GGI43DRAFT_230925 [Trichoderma evansii]